jgi:transcriptional regulator with XRE-family HTH domain
LRDWVNAQPRTKTQGDLAADLGIAGNTLSQYLGGHRIPSRRIALRLARRCGVPLENLLTPESERAS